MNLMKALQGLCQIAKKFYVTVFIDIYFDSNIYIFLNCPLKVSDLADSLGTDTLDTNTIIDLELTVHLGKFHSSRTYLSG